MTNDQLNCAWGDPDGLVIILSHQSMTETQRTTGLRNRGEPRMPSPEAAHRLSPPRLAEPEFRHPILIVIPPSAAQSCELVRGGRDLPSDWQAIPKMVQIEPYVRTET